jgi:hypothetical protein
VKMEFFDEPELEFGSGGTHVDIRHGIMLHGPLDLGEATAPTQIRVGLVGTAESVEGIRNWLEHCKTGVPAKVSRLGNLFPPFPGFGAETTFHCDLAFHDRWTSTLRQREIDQLLKNPGSPTLVQDCVKLFVDNVATVRETAGPMVVICAPPADLLDAVDARISRKGDTQEQDLDESADESGEDEIVVPAFHDLLKAEIMRVGIPIQMVRPSTYGGQARRRKTTRASSAPLQDEATRAWNIHTALYYKAGGAPWRLLRSPSELTTCFVGISFYRSLDGDRVMTSVAQVFNERGEGVIVKGAQAELDKNDRQPHLGRDDAKALLKNAIAVYRKEHRTTPARLVVHKTSRLTAGEVEGFEEAAEEHEIDSVELISVKRSFTRLYREGTYPTLRGSFLKLQPDTGLVYLRGSVQFFETYPGMYVPRPLELAATRSEASIEQIAREVLSLSKVNWNNTQFDGGEPITLRAARRVGDILKCIPDAGIVQPSFRFFI